MKKKRLISILTLFMCVALVSIGFAAWVITGNAHSEATGNVKVTTVEDQRLKIQGTKLSVQDIVFGAPSTIDDANSWLKATDVPKEAMTTELSFTVENNNQLDHIDITLEATAKSAEYEKAIKDGYIVAPTFDSRIEKIATADPQEYKVIFTWGWGAQFTSTVSQQIVNPYTFFNEVTSDGTDLVNKFTSLPEPKPTTNADCALKVMQELYKLDGVTFKVTINAVAVGSNQKQ